MKKRLFLLSITCLLITACSQQKERNTLGNVENLVTTTEHSESENMEGTAEQQTTSKNEQGNSRDMTLCQYISDSHFYDEESIDFYATGDFDANYNLKILNVHSSYNLEDGGSYFVSDNIKNKINEQKNSLETLPYLAEKGNADISYLFVNAAVTNLTSEKNTFCIHDLSGIFYRIYDDSMAEYGVSDKRIEATQSTEIFYDYGSITNIGKRYYYIDMEPNQTITTTILYLIPTNFLKEELYQKLNDNSTEGSYDYKLGRWMPTENETIKFLRIHLD